MEGRSISESVDTMELAREKPRLVGLGAKLVLSLAALAFLGVLVSWWFDEVETALPLPWWIGPLTFLVAIPLLCVLLLWLARYRSLTLARSLVAGLLVTVSVVINAGLALALFDYCVSGDIKVALEIIPIAMALARAAAIPGCLLGFMLGVVVSMAETRALKRQATGSDRMPLASSRRRRVLARLVMATIIASIAVALYFPVSYELSRRRAVLVIKASGGEVHFDGTSRSPIAEPLGWVIDRLSWPKKGVNWKRQPWLYSLESVRHISLGRDAGNKELTFVADLPEVNHLCVRNPTVTGAGLRGGIDRWAVTHLDLEGSGINDAGLRQLAGGATLSHLNLRGTSITDEGLRYLASVTSLTYLNLGDTAIGDEGLAHLAELVALRPVGATSLTYLDLSDTAISDEGLRHLAAFTSLKVLILDRTRISGPGLRHLTALARLESLILRGTQIRDDGLQHFGPMPSLGDLMLSNSQITGSGLKHLAPLRGLRRLDLSNINFSEKGLANLSKLPRLSHLSIVQARFTETTFQELSQLQQVDSIELRATNVEDTWLPHLAGMKKPSLTLFLDKTEVTREGLHALRKLLPQAKVFAWSIEPDPRLVP